MATVAGSLRNKVLVVDDLTSGDITVTDLVVSGTVTLQGTATTLDSTNTTVTDSIIELNSGLTGGNANDIGLILERGSTGNNVFIGWDESADKVVAGLTTDTGSSTGNLSLTYANFQAANATFTGSVTATTIDTGQGATEVYLMNQNVRTTDSPTFVNLTTTGTVTATGGNSTNWNTAHGWGNHASAGYLTSFTESDPVFTAHAASGVTSTKISNWDTAYGWGNHATAGYYPTSNPNGYTNDQTAAEILTAIKTVDGSGSGLDADKLDNQEGSYYLNYNNFTNTPTIPTNTNYYLDGITKSSNTLTFSVNGATNQTYTFGSNAFNSTTIPTNNNQLTNGAGYAPIASPTFTGDITIPNHIFHTGDGNTYMQFHAADQWRVVTGGTERLEVNNSAVTVSGALNVGQLKVDGKIVLDLPSNNPERGPWNPIVSSIRNSGRRLYQDEEFASGTNSVAVYNNSAGGAVTITREAATTNSGGAAPNRSGQVLRINHNGGTSSPGLGGIIHTITSEDNHTFVQIFQAKLRTGSNFVIAENAQGSNNTSYWLTETAGTDKWEWYARISHCGNTGTFSSGGHIYVNGGSGNFNWFLASSTVYDVTEVDTPLILEGGFAQSVTGVKTFEDRIVIGDGTDVNSRLEIRPADDGTADDIQFYNGSTRIGEIGTQDTTWLRINQSTSKNIYTPRYIRADAGFFVDSTAKGINGSGNFIGGTITGASDANVSNWDTAYGWGNHASAGYATGSFLPLSGGTITGTLTVDSGTSAGIKIDHDNFGNGLELHREDSTNAASVKFSNNAGESGVFYARHSDKRPIWRPGGTSDNHQFFTDNYHPNADKWTSSRTLTLGGDLSGSVSFDGSANFTLSAAVTNDSHNHSKLFENGTINFGGSYVQWTDQNGTGGTGLHGAAPRNPTNGWYHNLIMNHSNANGYYSQISTGLNTSDIYFSRVANGVVQPWQRIFADDYHPNADKWTTARTLTLGGDLSGNVSFDGSANFTLTATVADDSHNHIIGNIDGLQSALDNKTSLDHFRHTGHGHYTSTTTSALLTEALGDDAFDSKLTAHKTGWSYAGNGDLTDAGRLTELAGTSWLWWTDNSADNVQGNITALAIAPNTGGSAGKMFVYNNQGSGYSPGWREIWTSTSDGSGSGLDADLLDGEHASSFVLKSGSTMTGDLQIPNKIIHASDTDTYMSFAAADEWQLYCGGVRMIKAVEASSGVDYISFFPGTGNAGEIYFDGNGNIHADANITAYSTTTGSDKRLKENIRPLENSLDKVLGLDGVMFDWKKETRGKDQIGFIAQQVEEHVPELVGTMEDIDIGEAKTVNYEAVVPMLVEALKEQQSIINRLESRIKDLEDKG